MRNIRLRPRNSHPENITRQVNFKHAFLLDGQGRGFLRDLLEPLHTRKYTESVSRMDVCDFPKLGSSIRTATVPLTIRGSRMAPKRSINLDPKLFTLTFRRRKIINRINVCVKRRFRNCSVCVWRKTVLRRMRTVKWGSDLFFLIIICFWYLKLEVFLSTFKRARRTISHHRARVVNLTSSSFLHENGVFFM